MMKQTLCQHCGIRPASVFYRENNNGTERELSLCPDCAAKMGIGDLQDNLFSSFSLFSPHTEAKRGAVCPLCGSTLSQIRSRGKFGCSTCYDTFAPLLDLTPFVGKGYDAQEPKSTQEPSPKPHKTTGDEIAALKDRLRKAVAAEDYEQAAVLRDEIRAKEEK